VKRFFPALLTLLAALGYLGWVLVRSGGDPLALARLGTRYSAPAPMGTDGYDGQFNYYIAVDPNPASVAAHLDVPAYRYQRILYPLLARLLGVGQPAMIAWTLPILNLLILFVFVWQTGLLIEERGGSVWAALPIGLWAGLLASVRLDLAEPLALLLAVLALRTAGLDLNRRIPLTTLLLALALFAKETSLLFIAGFIVWSLVRRRYSRATTMALALIPFAIFQIWLWNVFGAPGIGSGGAGATPFEWIPFAGMVRIGEANFQFLCMLAIVYFPGLLLPCLYGIVAPIVDGLKSRFTPEAAFLFFSSIMISLAPYSTFREPLGILRLACGLILCMGLYAARRSQGWWTKVSLAGLAYLAFIAA
jgi:hypothetical protein